MLSNKKSVKQTSEQSNKDVIKVIISGEYNNGRYLTMASNIFN